MRTVWKPFVWMLLSITVLFIVVRLRPHRELYAIPPVLPEAAPAELVRTEGGLRLSNNPALFNGFLVERYNDGALKSRSEIHNGKLNGWSEGWYTNSQQQVRECFTNGVSHGLRTKWHPNGAKLSETPIVQGQVEGIMRKWRDDGTLAEVVEIRHGQPDGLAETYYPSGFLSARIRRSSGKNIEEQHWKDGEQPGAAARLR